MNFNQADLIKVTAVLTAVPRWIIALMRSEGIEVPLVWGSGLATASFILAIGMAATEALAINYILSAIRNQRDRPSRKLWYFMAAIMATFVGVMTPSIVASASGQTIEQVLGPYGLIPWGAMIALSTVLAVAGVGYASKDVKESGKKDDQEGANVDNQMDKNGQPVDKNGQSMDTAQKSKLKSTESIRVSILTILAEHPGRSVSMVAKQIGCVRQTVYNHLDELEKDGLVEKDSLGWRVASQDKTK